MKSHACLQLLGRILALLMSTGIAGAATPDSNAFSQTMMLGFLEHEARRLDETFLEGVAARETWETRRTELREQYLEMLGLWPMPERTPLQAQVTGVIEREEGYRVEKLHFQSRPGLYVTGNLYLPKDAQAGAKLPAVLYVCGHSGRGRDGNKTAFQHHGQWFATHGYVCLVIDTLQLGEIAGIHHGTYRHDRWWWQARGYTPAGVECWNGIRALDYLQSRPEVDPERLAVTGISGGGAASFWIAAADERVKVAVPVSGMGDLEDYVGAKVVNGHCDCMFLINTFQWSWAQIAALVAPRPLLFANSGHDTIFPMNGNDRIRARLERLYGLYTNRTDRLYDIAVVPGGHEDKPELRLMAYRWINRFLKGDDAPVTEPALAALEGPVLRAFPEALPADELNSRIDESFVPVAAPAVVRTQDEFTAWQKVTRAELSRLVLRNVRGTAAPREDWKLPRRQEASGSLPTEPGIEIPWRYWPAQRGGPDRGLWLVVLGEDESLDDCPDWVREWGKGAAVFAIAPRGSGSFPLSDPAPYYIKRSLALLGRTLDDCRVADAAAAAAQLLEVRAGRRQGITIAGRGAAGILAAYVALLEPRLSEVVVVDPPASHREGPTLLNVLRVADIPEMLGLLAPRPLTVVTGHKDEFEPTAALYRMAQGLLTLRAVP